MDACEINSTAAHHSKINPCRRELDVETLDGFTVGEKVLIRKGVEGKIHRFVQSRGMAAADVRRKYASGTRYLTMHYLIGLEKT